MAVHTITVLHTLTFKMFSQILKYLQIFLKYFIINTLMTYNFQNIF